MSDATKSDVYALQSEIRSLKAKVYALESRESMVDMKIDTAYTKFHTKLYKLKAEMFLAGYFLFLVLLLICAIMVKH